MLAVVKTPHIDVQVKGDIPKTLLNTLKECFGKKLVVEKSSDDEVINIRDSAFLRKIKKEMTPAKVLRHYRDLQSMTQAELGKKLGKSPRFISDLEHERRGISKEMAKSLAKIFGTSAERFL